MRRKRASGAYDKLLFLHGITSSLRAAPLDVLSPDTRVCLLLTQSWNAGRDGRSHTSTGKFPTEKTLNRRLASLFAPITLPLLALAWLGCGSTEPVSTADDAGPEWDTQVISLSLGDATTQVDGAVDKALFAGFTLRDSFGPCPIANGDCAGFVELTPERVLRLDRVGEGPDKVHTAMISAEDFSSAVAVLIDPSLRSLLSGGGLPCAEVVDVDESMSLDYEEATLKQDTATCTQAPLVAAREEMQSLADKYLPFCGDSVAIALFEQCRAADSEQPCKDAGGSWELSGDVPWPICICPTGQEGCVCKGSGDCIHGRCVGERAGGADTIGCGDIVQGTCTAVDPFKGCACMVGGDPSTPPICID